MTFVPLKFYPARNNCSLMFLGTAATVGIFSHLLKIDDALVGVMSCMSKILAGFVYAFATTDSMMYVGKYANQPYTFSTVTTIFRIEV